MASALETFAPVFARIAAGDHVSKACKAVGVHRQRLYEVVDGPDAIPELAVMYARVREWQADARADAIAELTEWLTAKALAGDITSEQVQAVRVAIDSEKWSASKLRPKVYGDRLEVSGQVQHAHLHALVPLTPDVAEGLKQLGARYARQLPNTPNSTDAALLPAAATAADPPTGGE